MMENAMRLSLSVCDIVPSVCVCMGGGGGGCRCRMMSGLNWR